MKKLLRFGIRDLLWAILVVGLALGWFVDSRSHAKRLKDYRYQEWRFEQLADVVQARWGAKAEIPSDGGVLIRFSDGAVVYYVRPN